MLTAVLTGLASVAIVGVHALTLVAVVARVWKRRDSRRLARLVGLALAVTWLLCGAALAIDLAQVVQSAVGEVHPADKATLLAAVIAEALNCLAYFLLVTALPLAGFLFLRVSAARTQSSAPE